MIQNSEEATRDQELKSLQYEAAWFVGREIPKVARNVRRILLKCMASLSPKGNRELQGYDDLLAGDDGDIFNADNVNKLSSFETPEGTLRGHISVSGWSISEAEIQVRFPKWNKNAPHKASISATHPWRLVQLQNAYNFIKMTFVELDALISKSERCLLNPDSVAFPAVSKMVRQVSDWLTQARQSLMIPSKNLFPNNLLTTTGFHPPLPQELHIEFSVCDSEIIVSVYALYIGMGVSLNGSEGTADKSKPSSSSGSNLPLLLQSVGGSSSGDNKGVQISNTGFMKHKTPSVGNLLNLNAFHSQTTAKNESDDQKATSALPQMEGVDSSSISVTQDHRVIINGTSFRTQQCTIRGAPCWVAVLDQAEVHCIIPRVNSTSELLMNALEVLADTADKLVALSLM